ncbi:MAG: hypothetical protein K8W52_13190 [Deltaproteobacteria bacterium]|nr:hypothetical protein [Deltaproteobacteria bacterium]
MVRRYLGVALVLAGVARAGTARAEIPTGAGTVKLELQLPVLDTNKPLDYLAPDTDLERKQAFNLARCVCSDAAPDSRAAQFRLKSSVTNGTQDTTDAFQKAPMDVWVGASCDGDVTTRNTNCTNLQALHLAHYYDLFAVRYPLFTVHQAVSSKNATGCEATAKTSTIWYFVDTDGAQTYETVAKQTIDYDGLAPALPTDINVDGGEESIHISFTPETGSTADVYYYQMLCSTGGKPAFDKPPVTAKYFTPKALCDVNQSIELTERPLHAETDIDAGHPDATPDAAPDAGPDAAFDAGPGDASPPSPDAQPIDPTTMESLDSSFLCGEAPGGATEVTASGLKNDTPYRVILLVVDQAGNPAGVTFLGTVTPQPVTDFWEDTHDQGSKVEGGFCLMADTYGDGGPITRALRAFRDDTLASTLYGRALTHFYYNHVAWLGEYVAAWWPLRVVAAIVLLPLVAFALAWHLFTLPGLILLLGVGMMLRRRRLRGRTARLVVAGAAVALAMLHTGAAHAQSTTPYWDDPAFGDEPTGVSESKWIIGIKLGPYVPAIDAQFQDQTGKATRPYHEMFGGYNIVPELEVDRIVWSGFGQVGVGGSIGFLGKTANAFVDGSIPGEPNRPRSPGDETSFRLMPMAVTASYRLTYFDDRFGVPVIPYIRAGFSYYMWWIRQPSGELAQLADKNCHPDNADHACAENKAIGASAGVQASIGLAIRAERIDADAAGSMAESGIEHAGFYIEYQAAKVDGFGKDSKLAVGDSTWFAGFDFEF